MRVRVEAINVMKDKQMIMVMMRILVMIIMGIMEVMMMMIIIIGEKKKVKTAEFRAGEVSGPADDYDGTADDEQPFSDCDGC